MSQFDYQIFRNFTSNLLCKYQVILITEHVFKIKILKVIQF